MAQPDLPKNPLVVIASKDVVLPVAKTDNKLPPRDILLSQGYDRGMGASAEEFNYIFNNLAQYIQYSLDKSASDISDIEAKLNAEINALQSQVVKERVSVGEIIEITGVSTNPSVLKGYGTWKSIGEGVVLVGVGTHKDTRGESKTWTDGQKTGEYRHVQAKEEIAPHTHESPYSEDLNQIPIAPFGRGSTKANRKATEGGTYDGNLLLTSSSGKAAPMNNIQPTMAVYRWQRTA